MVNISIGQNNMANKRKTKQWARYGSNQIWTHPGKYQNKKMENLPMSYLKWGLDNFRTNGPQHTLIQIELSSRLGIL